MRAIVIVVVYILSFSSLAYIGVFFTVLFFAINFGLVRYFLIAIPLGFFLFFAAYNNADEFKSRIDGAKALFIDGILDNGASVNGMKAARVANMRSIIKQTHGSSFVLYNNMHISYENFKQNPLFGSGLGSQELAFDLYNLNYIIGGIYKFNSSDANSMFLRIMSETGLMGIIFTFIFIFRFYVSRNLLYNEDDEYWLLSNALLVLMLAQLLRQGNYTFGGFFIYPWMYYFNYIRYRDYRNSIASLK